MLEIDIRYVRYNQMEVHSPYGVKSPPVPISICESRQIPADGFPACGQWKAALFWSTMPLLNCVTNERCLLRHQMVSPPRLELKTFDVSSGLPLRPYVPGSGPRGNFMHSRRHWSRPELRSMRFITRSTTGSSETTSSRTASPKSKSSSWRFLRFLLLLLLLVFFVLSALSGFRKMLLVAHEEKYWSQ